MPDYVLAAGDDWQCGFSYNDLNSGPAGQRGRVDSFYTINNTPHVPGSTTGYRLKGIVSVPSLGVTVNTDTYNNGQYADGMPAGRTEVNTGGVFRMQFENREGDNVLVPSPGVNASFGLAHVNG